MESILFAVIKYNKAGFANQLQISAYTHRHAGVCQMMNFDISLIADGDPDTCAVRDLFIHLSGKWSTLILLCLAVKPYRFGALNRLVPHISKRMLTEALRELEFGGFVARRVFPSKLPAVEYSLTPLGQSLIEPLDGLVGWAIKNQAAIRAARENYKGNVRVSDSIG